MTLACVPVTTGIHPHTYVHPAAGSSVPSTHDSCNALPGNDLSRSSLNKPDKCDGRFNILRTTHVHCTFLLNTHKPKS